jgi:glucose-6-phosphate isomerase
MLTLDISSLQKISPEHGISQTEINTLSARCSEYLKKIHARSQGFYSDEVLGKSEDKNGRDHSLHQSIINFANSVKGKYDHIVLLGIGGSSLGPIALRESLAKKDSCNPSLHVLDNIDPDFLAETEEKIDLKKTLFLAISKSGTTPETASQYLYFSKKIENAGLKLAEHIVFVTDPKNGFFREEAQKKNIPAFEIPPNVGGRFSVLTPVGLLPAALIGIDIKELLVGAQEMRDNFFQENAEKNLAFLLASIQYIAQQKGKSQNVMYAYSQKLFRVADWFRQLLAESTGKKWSENGEEIFAGMTPIAALGATDQHSQNQLYFEGPNDKLFLFLETEKFDSDMKIPVPDDERFSYLHNTTFGELLNVEKKGTEGALNQVNRPNITIKIPEISAKYIGQIFMLLEGATAFLGEFLNINAFDQPGVELSKNITRELLQNN